MYGALTLVLGMTGYNVTQGKTVPMIPHGFGAKTTHISLSVLIGL